MTVQARVKSVFHNLPDGIMAETDQSARAEKKVDLTQGTIRESAEADNEDQPRRDLPGAYEPATELTFAELVELWHHQHNVAMHKERLYLPSSLAVLVGTVLGWKDLSAVVVSLAAVVSVGLYCYLVLIIEDFGSRQDRFFIEMQRRRRDILHVMFNESKARFGSGSTFVRAPTVQRRLRRPFIATLIAVWIGLILVKLAVL
jgi:hypothetical protein